MLRCSNIKPISQMLHMLDVVTSIQPMKKGTCGQNEVSGSREIGEAAIVWWLAFTRPPFCLRHRRGCYCRYLFIQLAKATCSERRTKWAESSMAPRTRTMLVARLTCPRNVIPTSWDSRYCARTCDFIGDGGGGRRALLLVLIPPRRRERKGEEEETC